VRGSFLLDLPWVHRNSKAFCLCGQAAARTAKWEMRYTLPVKNLSPPTFGSIMFANSRRFLAPSFLVLFLWTCCLDVVTAQVADQRRAKRRTFVEGLLQGLLESQLEQSKQPGSRFQQHARQGVVPRPSPTVERLWSCEKPLATGPMNVIV